VATIDRAVTGRPGLGDLVLGRTGPAAARAGWYGVWFAPGGGRRNRLLDLLVAAAIAVIEIAGTIVYSQDEPSRWEFDAFAAIVLIVGPVALLFRRRWPEATLIVAFAAAAGYAATGYPRGPAGFPAFVVAMVTAIMVGRSVFAWGVLVVAFPVLTLLPSRVPDEVEKARGVAGTAANLTWLPFVAAAAEIGRVRYERGAELAHAEREEARRRASEERLLVARELHDVLAHTISLISVQSGVALHLLDRRPEQVRPALEAINGACDEALGELRSVIDVLSRGLGEGAVLGDDQVIGEGAKGAGDRAGEWAPRAPTPGLRELDGLVRRTRAAGLDVEVAVDGEAEPVPAGVDLAAFRIVQEALTNVVRHAGSDARANVPLAYTPAELMVQVDDDGRGSDPARGRPGSSPTTASGLGRGISGMRERVQALGGTLAAGPRPGRGFRVRAEFPLHGGV
jgi:signal transduction histidine kinase